ncbi:DUF6038 family protein [Staphylococcus chromogenes]|nr:DUF6038 family protein [Staphylococcus chromogenes]MDU0431165.1 DUF6038 family protein [Staphylococcus chromogenes]MDU0451339.1 DUF6038 family protein [Staphylococcus chromogenes]
MLNKLYLPSLNKRINRKIVTYNIQNNDESKIREKLRRKIVKYPYCHNLFFSFICHTFPTF